jgi:site-specific DNA-cytosine methylase
MTTYSHGHVIPLVGGSVVGASLALNSDPAWIASWGSSFGANDQYCLKYFDKVPYYELDDKNYPTEYVDIITCLPPCAGLSLANVTTGKTNKNPRGCNAPSNMHMYYGAEFAMSKIGSRVLMVENAPMLFSKGGEMFAEKINSLASQYGYTMSLIKTSSIYHGVPQERTRSFFFLWKGDKVPILEPIVKPYLAYHDVLRTGSFAPSDPVTSKQAPSTDVLWQFIQSKHPGRTKQDILYKVANTRMVSVWEHIYKSGWLPEAAQTVADPKVKRWLEYTLDKKNRGLNIMDGSMKLAWSRTQALMWKSLPMLMHPYEDRWLTVAEGLALMGFPDDYAAKVHIPTKHSNVICQNVPACTAQGWVEEIVEALNGNRTWVTPAKKADGSTKILRQSNTAKVDPMVPMWQI